MFLVTKNADSCNYADEQLFHILPLTKLNFSCAYCTVLQYGGHGFVTPDKKLTGKIKC
jgi:hypothetical protein